MEEGRKESDEGVDVPPLECHEPDLSLAGSKEVDNRVRTAVIFRQPFFANHRTKTSTETSGETGEPEAVDRYRETGWLKGGGWIGNAC